MDQFKAEILESMRHRLSAMAEPACIKDSGQRFLAANQPFADIFGLDADAFSGVSWADLLDPVLVSDWSRTERRCLATGRDQSCIFDSPAHRVAHVAMMKRFEGLEGEFYTCSIASRVVEAKHDAGDGQGPEDLKDVIRDLQRFAEDNVAGRFSDADFRHCLGHLKIGVLVYDGNDVLRFANPAFYDMYEPYRGAIVPGMHVKEVLGVVYDTLIAVDRRKTIAGYEAKREIWISRRLDVHAQPVSQVDIEMPDGRWFRLYHQRFGNGLSIALRMDITGMKTGEGPTETVMLRQQKDEDRAVPQPSEPSSGWIAELLDTMPVCVLLVSGDLVIEHANAFFRSWLEARLGHPVALAGKTLEEFVRANMEAGLYPEQSELFPASPAERVARILASTDQQQEMTLRNGVSMAVRSHKLCDGRLVITYCDLSDIKRQDEEMLKAQQRLSDTDRLLVQIANVMDQGLVLLENARTIFSNDAAYRLLGLPAGFLSHDTLMENGFAFCSRRGDFEGNEAEVLEVFADIRQALCDGRVLTRRLFLKSLKFWIKIDLLPLGENRIAAVLTDITEQTQREEELQRMILRAETADKAKTRLLGEIGQQIRTPMNGVVGMTELLLKSSLDIKQKAFVDIIANSGHSMMTVVNDILDASKMVEGSLKLASAAFSPADAIGDVATMMSTKAREKSLEMVVRCDPDLPASIVGDVVRFRQIIKRFVGNAIRFTEAGHVLVSASVRHDSARVRSLVVKVIDTGPGVQPAELAHFNRIFSEPHQSHVHVHDNTGLSLSIVSGLAAMMGGRLHAESTMGHGVTMTLDLPFETKDETPFMTEERVAFAGTRMIVVDNVDICRNILVEHLQEQGIDAVGVDDGDTALRIMQQAADAGLNVDVVVANVSDIHSGIGTCLKTMRTDTRLRDVAIVGLKSLDTVYAGTGQQATLFDACVMKPVRMNLLQKTLLDLVKARKSATAHCGYRTCRTAVAFACP